MSRVSFSENDCYLPCPGGRMPPVVLATTILLGLTVPDGQSSTGQLSAGPSIADQSSAAQLTLTQLTLGQVEADPDASERDDSSPVEVAHHRGLRAFEQGDYEQAARHFREALKLQPDEVQFALFIAECHLRRGDQFDLAVDVIGTLVEQFPDEGRLQSYYSMALAGAGRFPEAVAALDRARQLGADPERQLGEDVVHRIRELGTPAWYLRYTGLVVGLLAAYVGILATMAISGWLLSVATRRKPVSLPVVVEGQLTSTGRERLLVSTYISALTVSALLFLCAIPMMSLMVILATIGIIWLILSMRVASLYLLAVVGFAGVGMAYSLWQSVFFAASDPQSSGIDRSERDAPRLWSMLKEVAAAVGSPPADSMVISTGSSMSIEQRRRGMFGLFGVPRRVLVMGLAVASYLTVAELQALLAREFAHHSRHDSFSSRFVFRATESMPRILTAMKQSLGHWTYINPFYWAFWLYYQAHVRLAALFLRSREHLADRLAASIYGRTALVSGLRKLATEGPLFEASLNHHLDELVEAGRPFDNVFVECRELRNVVTEQEQASLFANMLDVDSAPHPARPTLSERIAAVDDLPDRLHRDAQPAAVMFDDLEAIEQDLTNRLLESYRAFLEPSDDLAGEENSDSEICRHGKHGHENHGHEDSGHEKHGHEDQAGEASGTDERSR